MSHDLYACQACGKELHPPGGEVCRECFVRGISGWIPDAAECIANAERLHGEDSNA